MGTNPESNLYCEDKINSKSSPWSDCVDTDKSMIIYSMIWWSIIRFRIKSSDSGFIANSYDIASFLCLLPGRHPHHQCRHQHHRDPLHDADMMSLLMSMMLTQSDSSRWLIMRMRLTCVCSFLHGRSRLRQQASLDRDRGEFLLSAVETIVDDFFWGSGLGGVELVVDDLSQSWWRLLCSKMP